MLIYRVQNENGEGPFAGHSREDFKQVGHTKDEACWYDGPNPQAEARNESWDAYASFDMVDRVCGVPARYLLERWFPVPEALAALEYSLTVWEVACDEDLDAFTYQVVFKPETATLLATLPIGETWDATLEAWQKTRA